MCGALQRMEHDIINLVQEYYSLKKKINSNELGTGKIHYAGRCYDEKEIVAAVQSILDFTLTYGKEGVAFERELAAIFGSPKSFVVNSGSSANLIALSTLCSSQLGDAALKPGDEVIVPATSFPTTVAPIIQNGLIPVFIDTQVGFYNPDIQMFKDAYSPKTRAVIFAHTLGNPAQIDLIKAFCQEKNLFLIEDCCDALGSTYHGKQVGTFGDMATCSFYPAHHITMGEGGAVVVNNQLFAHVVNSLRSWGKECWCMPGAHHEKGACKKRFSMQYGKLPFGYDHKYVYTNIGYNLKPLDLQCAIGREQLKKLPDFIQKRKEHFTFLHSFFKQYEDIFILPQSLPEADPCWFAYPLTVQQNAPFGRNELMEFLECNQVETRMLFAGNIIRQPGFLNISLRIVGDLATSDFIMKNTFFVGVYPGLTESCLGRMTNAFKAFISSSRHKPGNVFFSSSNFSL